MTRQRWQRRNRDASLREQQWPDCRRGEKRHFPGLVIFSLTLEAVLQQGQRGRLRVQRMVLRGEKLPLWTTRAGEFLTL